MTPQRSLTNLVQQAELSPEDKAELCNRVHSQVKMFAECLLKSSRSVFRNEIRPTALTDDALMEMLRYWRGYENSTRFYRSARKFLDHALVDLIRSVTARKRGGDWHASSEVERLETAADSPDVEASAKEQLELLHTVIQDTLDILPEEAGVVFVSKVFLDVSLTDQAANQGVSRDLIKRHWNRAKEALASRLAEAGFDSGGQM